MATEQQKPPAETQKVQRDRSPAYPFISLRVAFERAAAFDGKFGRHGSPYNKAGIAWGYKGDGSQAQQTTSALKYYGLVEYTGPTNNRMVVLTEDAKNYMRAQQASSKAEIARACALRPKAMRTYWSRWGADRPIDEICLDQLILRDNFTDGAAKTFLRVYDETIAFAGLQNGSKIDEDDADAEPEAEIQQEDVPSQVPRAQSEPKPVASANRSAIPPKGFGMRQETFVLAEGDVTIQWPERLSPESLEDFTDWLALLQRRVKRSVLSSPVPPAPVEEGPTKPDTEL